ncbi:MAG: hypothetical protein P8Y58_09505 [Novosphingobium sp.]
MSNNQGLTHRVVPYADEGRVMHRTSISGKEKPGNKALEAHVEGIYQIA